MKIEIDALRRDYDALEKTLIDLRAAIESVDHVRRKMIELPAMEARRQEVARQQELLIQEYQDAIILLEGLGQIIICYTDAEKQIQGNAEGTNIRYPRQGVAKVDYQSVMQNVEQTKIMM